MASADLGPLRQVARHLFDLAIDILEEAFRVRERKLSAANMRYYVIATTWHYYRFYFGLSLEDSVECARMAIAQALEGLGVRVPDRSRSAPRR